MQELPDGLPGLPSTGFTHPGKRVSIEEGPFVASLTVLQHRPAICPTR
jgi:hypothetical protein